MNRWRLRIHQLLAQPTSRLAASVLAKYRLRLLGTVLLNVGTGLLEG